MPHTEHVPKCLVPVCGKPILEWQLDALGHIQVERYLAVTGYRKQSLLKYRNLEQVENGDWATSNIARSLKLGLDHVLATDNIGADLIVTYGDIIYSPRVVRSLAESSGEFSTVVDLEYRKLWARRFANPLDDLETLRLDGQRIISIGARARSYDEIDGQYIGLTKLSHRMVLRLAETLRANPDNVIGMSITPLIDYMIRRKRVEVTASFTRGGWIEVDTVSDLKLANESIADFVN